MPPTGVQIPASITSLTDDELYVELMQYNVRVGPVLPSTRPLYERKLFKLQTGMDALPSTSYEPVDNDDEEDDDDNSADDEVILQQHQQPRLRTTRSLKPEKVPPPRQPPRQGDRTPATRSQPPQAQREASRGGLPFWVKLVAILAVAAIVFLVIKNLESDPASQAPEIPEQLEINV